MFRKFNNPLFKIQNHPKNVSSYGTKKEIMELISTLMEGSGASVCSSCKGKGDVSHMRYIFRSHRTGKCIDCDGSGLVFNIEAHDPTAEVYAIYEDFYNA